MKAKIFRPAKSAMQSGKNNAKKWLVVPIVETDVRIIEPLMGWITTTDTSSQLHFAFPSKEEAIKFAQEKGFEYEVEEPKTSPVKQKSYAANFTS
jgi:hypothetical protein